MRLWTRGDFDGLVSGVLITVVEDIRSVLFVHPKDVQDGKYQAEPDDIIINLPHVPGCYLWFDHHISEEAKLAEIGEFNGRFEVAPSAARVVYNHYRDPRFEQFQEILEAADKLDSANLTMEEVTDPEGWILLGLTLDPRSGLGPAFQKYFRWLMEYVKEVSLATVLAHPEVKKRADRVLEEMEDFKDLLSRCARQEGNVIITDVREEAVPAGNRFLVYTLFPTANVELRLFRGKASDQVMAVGHSIFNRTCNVNVGELLSRHGGGGHRGAGTLQFSSDRADELVSEILGVLKENAAT